MKMPKNWPTPEMRKIGNSLAASYGIHSAFYVFDAMVQLAPLPDELEEFKADADRFRQLRELCGYVQDGSNVTLSIYQDDATHDWFISTDSQRVGSGASLEAAIADAISKNEQQTEEDELRKAAEVAYRELCLISSSHNKAAMRLRAALEETK